MEELDYIKKMAPDNATDKDLEIFRYISNTYKLDPVLKEIWCIKRNAHDPALIMTSRDGYLKIAHSSGMLDGLISGTIENEKGELVKGWCEVWRKDMSHSFKSEVKYSEYKQSNFIWQKYPSAMLIKVAEVFALKRAFSISGMLTQEEMGDDYKADGEKTEEPKKEPISKLTSKADINVQESYTNIIKEIEKCKTAQDWNDKDIDAKAKFIKPLLNEEQIDTILEWRAEIVGVTTKKKDVGSAEKDK